MKAILLITAAATALAGCSYSARGPAENRSVERAGLVASGDVDATGSAEYSGLFVDAGGNISRDLSLAGANVVSDARVGGNLNIEGARIRFTGSVEGDTEIAGAAIYLDGLFGGRMEVIGARAIIDGNILGELDATGTRFNLRGNFASPVHIRGSGDNGRNGRVMVSGTLEQGGYICARHVNFRSNARVNGALHIIAEARPDWDGAFDYEPLGPRDCEDIHRARG
ncbi:MAG: hypothetical protein COW29_04475 [Rhodobacterales bacterium CG15_BIG_FIL_POST_REV_8_21_14_020_59_13]|nr:MAG: hypothetical protein COW29_04475 [Rhodobacterales bacterium CG15_BIG_FIL_POST_REV_8_21_14_020_59_13]